MSGEIDDFLKLFGADVEDEAHPAGDAFEIPNVGAGRNELNMAHPLTPELFGDDFDPALFAGDALVTDLLVLAAMAFVVLARTEDLFAEQTTHFGLLRTIVDRFGFGDFAMAPTADGVGRG